MRFLLLFLVALSACTLGHYVPGTDPAVDSALTRASIPQLNSRKVVLRGPVIFQTGTGNSASIADNRKAGQRHGSAATAPGATATTTTKRAGLPWYWLVLAALAGAVGWEVLSAQVAPLRWLPWRARPG